MAEQIKSGLAQAYHALTQGRPIRGAVDSVRNLSDDDLGDFVSYLRRMLVDAFGLDRHLALSEARRLVLERLQANVEVTPCIMAEEGRPKWFDPNLGAVDDNQALGPRRWWAEYKSKLGQKVSEPALAKIEKDCLEIVNGALNRPNDNDLLRKSLVVGRVQSGKTASMAGVIAMAADAGYNLFIVLSGTKENLRRQTNARLLKDLNCEGAGLVLKMLTNDVDSGWTFGAAGSFEHWYSQNLQNEGTRALGVVLKNGIRLKSLADALATFPLGRHPQVRCLVIDDESDEGSVNGKYNPRIHPAEQNPAVINLEIKRIVHQSLPSRVSYLAYTATPFANVLQEPPNDKLPNLYPESFIHHLHQPSDYIGFKQIHGDPDSGSEGLNIICEIDESDAAAMRALNSPEAPNSMKQALAWFIVASAERIARNESSNKYWPHCSMLVHGAVKKGVHTHNFAMISNVLSSWKSDPRLLVALLKSEDLENISQRVGSEDLKRVLNAYSKFENLEQRNGIRPVDSLVQIISQVLDRLEVVVDNSGTAAEDRLLGFREPENNDDAKFQVICGGSTLSRGLTIEGLLCSYFYRRAGNMDALMQMGRWCGYRHDYEDLCRIWTTPRLQDTLSEAVLVESQLESQIAWMRRENRTPKDYGIRLRRNPGGIILTSRMKASERVAVDYTGECPQTILFENNLQRIQSNWNAGIRLIKKLPTQSDLVWRRVDVELILEFLENYTPHPESAVFEGSWIQEFISGGLEGALFNVAIITGRGEVINFAGYNINSVERSRFGNKTEGAPSHLNIKSLRGPADMLRDVDGDVSQLDGMSEKINYRMTHGYPPLLLLYPIHKDSSPSGNASSKNHRKGLPKVPLQALDHLLGVSFIFGGDRYDNRGVEVAMPVAPPEEENEE